MNTLYPREYTRAISLAVKNNLRIANQNETVNLGQTVVALSYMANFPYMSNDSKLIPQDLETQLREQSQFSLNLVAIVIQGKVKDKDPSYVDRIDGIVYDFNTNREVKLSEVYLLPDLQIIAKGEDMFLFPVSKLHWLGDNIAYVLAYKVDYSKGLNDELYEISLKAELRDLHDKVINNCMLGNQNGLSLFFNPNNEEFKGFYMPKGIYSDSEKLKKFADSVEIAFKSYEASKKFAISPQRKICIESLQGVGLIVSAAALVNNYWLPEAWDYMQK